MATELIGTFRHKAFLLSDKGKALGREVKLKGGVTTDFPATGDKVMPAGAVVVLKTSDGLYYLANDAANGDRNTPAVVTSIEKPDADWKDKTLTWTVYYPDGEVATGAVAASGADDDTIAEWVTLLNADPAFAAHLTASDSGAGDLLVCTTKSSGRVGLKISLDLDTAYTTDDGASSSATDEGAEADYRVITEQRSLVSLTGASRTSDSTPGLLAGHFDESELTGLTLEAKAVLIGRGSLFE